MNGTPVPVTGTEDDVTIGVALPAFKNWLSNVEPGLTITSIRIRDAKDYGPVHFLAMHVDAQNDLGETLPGYTFLRGGSTAILVILNCEGEQYLVLVKQARVPVGKTAMLEIPAGVGVGKVTAIQELAQELGIEVGGDLVFPLRDRPLYSSPGASDEAIHYFCLALDVSRPELERLNGRFTGVRIENERILTVVMPLEQACAELDDTKLFAALTLYEQKQHDF